MGWSIQFIKLNLAFEENEAVSEFKRQMSGKWGQVAGSRAQQQIAIAMDGAVFFVIETKWGEGKITTPLSDNMLPTISISCIPLDTGDGSFQIMHIEEMLVIYYISKGIEQETNAISSYKLRIT